MTALAPNTWTMPDHAATSRSHEFAGWVTQHQRAVCAVAFSATGDRATSEEIAQEAFLLAWRKLPELSEPPKLPAWICGIARNLAKNARRSARRTEASDTLDAIAAESESPLDQAISAESSAIVRRVLDGLPETYREPLVLYYRHDRSVREVARALDLSELAAKQRLSRGRAQLEEQVRALVERTLRASAPGAAFTATVVAAFALTPASAQAASAGSAAGSAKVAAGGLRVAGGLVALGAAVVAGTLLIGGLLMSRSGGQGSDGSVAASLPSTSQSAEAATRAPNSRGAIPGPHFRPLRAGAKRALPPSSSPSQALSVGPGLARALEKRVDLQLKDVEVSKVLSLIADVTGVPVLNDGGVSGDITLDLKAVTVQEALDDALDRADAVWSEVELVRVVDGDGPPGPALGGPSVDLELKAADVRNALATLGKAMGRPVLVAKDLAPAPVDIHVKALPAGEAFAQIVAAAGLRYEIVDAIEVRPDDDAGE